MTKLLTNFSKQLVPKQKYSSDRCIQRLVGQANKEATRERERVRRCYILPAIQRGSIKSKRKGKTLYCWLVWRAAFL